MESPSAYPITRESAPPPSEAKSSRKTIILIIVVMVALLLLCCCVGVLADPAGIMKGLREGCAAGLGQ